MSISSYNSVGHSEEVTISAVTRNTEMAEMQVDAAHTGSLRTRLVITPILGALIGVGAGLGLVTFSIVLVMCCRDKQGRHREYRLGNTEKEQQQLSPDVIRNRKGKYLAIMFFTMVTVSGSMEDESGFELYQDKNFSTLNNRSSNLPCIQKAQHKNVFIESVAGTYL